MKQLKLKFLFLFPNIFSGGEMKRDRRGRLEVWYFSNSSIKYIPVKNELFLVLLAL